jgi:hypothetical protein
MAEEHSSDQISKKRLVYTIDGMEHVEVRKDLVYLAADMGALTMDVYSPPRAKTTATRLPAVVFVAGYSDIGYEKKIGCRFKDMAMSVSWARLAAASGLIGVAYANREPATDLDALLTYVRDHAAALGIDEQRLGVCACSGNVPLAVWALMQRRYALRCGALLYGYTLDLDGATGVAEAAAMFGFTNPNRGMSVSDLPDDLPLFLVRAGQEQFPGLNESIDRFVAAALTLNRPLTLVNHAAGGHAFDLQQDTGMSREIIRRVLDFLKFQLTLAGS